MHDISYLQMDLSRQNNSQKEYICFVNSVGKFNLYLLLDYQEICYTAGNISKKSLYSV